ncbi:unnamed protein product [Blepharisma stoltei]|uniref:PilZ domain-containing protein n=1 Tax=Blepharisma stoltei TaxID=1481888 RepID=A0AAU9J7A3_9CILI|nr:unnamed protein product [Blepharisma stoltei]
MGACCGSEKKEDMVRSTEAIQPKLVEPAYCTFESPNFRLEDYSKKIGNMEMIEDIRDLIFNYRPADIRCQRYPNDPPSRHSFILITGEKQISEETLEDSGLIIDYSENGFRILLGDEKIISLAHSNNKKIDPVVELLIFPGSDSKTDKGFHEIIEWSYEHKDELCTDPSVTPELNMGKRLYKYIVDMLHWNSK